MMVARQTHPQLPAALSVEQLRRKCDPASLGFKSTQELEPLDNLIGQERALEAISFASEMRQPGFNLFVLGPAGSGRRSTVMSVLKSKATKEALPADWVYLNNFSDPGKPVAVALPPGTGPKLRSDLEELTEDLSIALPTLFESDDYRTLRQTIDDEIEQAQEDAFEELRDRATSQDVAILRTPMGFALAPIQNGQVMKPEVFNALPAKERETVQAKIEELQGLLEEILQRLPQIEKQRREKLRKLNDETARMGVDILIDELNAKYKHIPTLEPQFESMRQDVITNVETFLKARANDQDNPFPVPQGASSRNAQFARYSANVIVTYDKSESEFHAPIVQEELPSHHNLVGRIEHVSHMGALLTDFTLIKPGALHKANGGYLILDARSLLTQPFAWEALKTCIRSGQITITSPAEQLSLTSTISLEPDPIPLSVKVVLIGERLLYYLLSAYDPDFSELFKVEADFDDELDWSKENAQIYARLLASVANRNRLLPLSARAVAEVLAVAARFAGDSQKLTLQISELSDLLMEADHVARSARARKIGPKHVQKAIDARDKRQARVREKSQEAVLRNIIMVDTGGTRTGQVNALSVMSLGNFSFGRPSRISARTRLGSGKVVDIEREVELGGPLHSKGVLILSSFLRSRFVPDEPVSLSASLVFEQSYGGVDGDSASCAELYAILSSLSELPIKQCFAVTGSVNQYGEVQAIGGVNEKIEGFFDICAKRGLTGDQGVLIPLANVEHLMLRPDVVEASSRKKFHVIPVEHIDQGIEILTGTPAGRRDLDGNFPAGTVNGLVEACLRKYNRVRRRFSVRDKAEPEAAGNSS